MKRMLKRAAWFLAFGCVIFLCVLFAEGGADGLHNSAVAPAANQAAPAAMMPWWAYLGGIPAINIGLFGLKKIAPKIPAKWVPLIGYGIAGGISAIGLPILDPTSLFLNTTVVSGGAALTHNTVKSILKGDSLGQESAPVR